MRITGEREVNPGVIRFELDRSITGTGHEAYSSPPKAQERICDVLAARLFAAGDVRSVHLFSNMVSVTLGAEDSSHEVSQLRSVIQQLFIHYHPGVVPTQV